MSLAGLYPMTHEQRVSRGLELSARRTELFSSRLLYCSTLVNTFVCAQFIFSTVCSLLCFDCHNKLWNRSRWLSFRIVCSLALHTLGLCHTVTRGIGCWFQSKYIFLTIIYKLIRCRTWFQYWYRCIPSFEWLGCAAIFVISRSAIKEKGGKKKRKRKKRGAEGKAWLKMISPLRLKITLKCEVEFWEQ